MSPAYHHLIGAAQQDCAVRNRKKNFSGLRPVPPYGVERYKQMDKAFDAISILVMATFFYGLWLITP